MVYTTLVLSGGSIKGVGFLGALQYIHKTSPLSNLDQFYGTSVGSIICVLLAIGLTPAELFIHFNGFGFSLSLNMTKHNIELINYEKFLYAIQSIIQARLGYVPTLEQLQQEYHKKLFILTYNYTQNRAEILSYKTRPNMSCLDAIRLSCALPFIFCKTVYENNIYFDGGLVCNFPLNIAFRHKAKNIVAINLFSTCKRSLDDNYWTILFNVVFAPIENKTVETINKYGERCAFVQLNIDVPFTQFQMDFTQALKCYLCGYFTAQKKLRAT